VSPTYIYRCVRCKFFEAQGGFEQSFTPCPQCGLPARREPVSGVPATNTETVGFKPGRDLSAVHRSKVQKERV
jgi:hypothetical protein